MNTDKLKESAREAKKAAEDFVSSPQVQSAVNKGKEAFEKGKDWLENGKGKEYLDKARKRPAIYLTKFKTTSKNELPPHYRLKSRYAVRKLLESGIDLYA